MLAPWSNSLRTTSSLYCSLPRVLTLKPFGISAGSLPRAEKVAAGFDNQPLVEAKIRQSIIFGYSFLEAEKQADHAALTRNAARAYELIRRVHGDEHENTYEAMIMLAAGHCRLKQFSEAESLFAKVLDGFLRQEPGVDWHPTMMNAADGLADLYHKQGKDVIVAFALSPLDRYHPAPPSKQAAGTCCGARRHGDELAALDEHGYHRRRDLAQPGRRSCGAR